MSEHINVLEPLLKLGVLYVDDELKSLKYFKRCFGDTYNIFTAESTERAYTILDEHQSDIAVIISDQRMPGETGVRLLAQTRMHYPRIVRILATAYADMQVAIDAINKARAHSYIVKPWEVEHMSKVLEQSGETYLKLCKYAEFNSVENCFSSEARDNQMACISALGTWVGIHMRDTLSSAKQFLSMVPHRLSEELPEGQAIANSNFWNDYRNQISNQLDQVTQTSTDLWTMSNASNYHFSDEVKVYDVIAAVEDDFSEILSKYNIKIENQVSQTFPLLTADRPKLSRLFELLIKSKIQENLAEGGKIFIAAEQILEDDKLAAEISIEAVPAMKKDILEAVESSIVSPADEKRMSELGLSILTSFLIIYRHGGKVLTPGPGLKENTLRFVLPTDANIPSVGYDPEDFLNRDSFPRFISEYLGI